MLKSIQMLRFENKIFPPNHWRYTLKKNQLIALILINTSSYTFSKNQKNQTIDGYLASRLEVEEANGELNHLARITLETDRYRGARGNLSLRAQTISNSVLIREVSIDKKFESGHKLKFGYTKKKFGLEYLKGRLSRLSIHRSYLYEYLEKFGYAGRETSIAYFQKLKKKSGKDGFNISLSYAESRNISILTSWQTFISDNWATHLFAQIQLDNTDEGNQIVGAFMPGLSYQSQTSQFQWELVAGVDPEESELRKLIDEKHPVMFLGQKLHYENKIFDSEQDYWAWFLQSNLLYHDLDLPRYNTVQGMLGLSYHSDRLRISTNLAIEGRNTRVNLSDRETVNSYNIELLYEI